MVHDTFRYLLWLPPINQLRPTRLTPDDNLYEVIGLWQDRNPHALTAPRLASEASKELEFEPISILALPTVLYSRYEGL